MMKNGDQAYAPQESIDSALGQHVRTEQRRNSVETRKLREPAPATYDHTNTIKTTTGAWNILRLRNCGFSYDCSEQSYEKPQLRHFGTA